MQLDAISVVTGIMTRGRRFYAGEYHPNYFQWVTKYKVFHSYDGLTFSPVVNINGDQVSNTQNPTYVHPLIFIVRVMCVVMSKITSGFATTDFGHYYAHQRVQ